mgnify:CR=1 FL=1
MNALIPTATEQISNNIVPALNGILSRRLVITTVTNPINTPSAPVSNPAMAAIFLGRTLRKAIATPEAIAVMNNKIRNTVAASNAVMKPSCSSP